nr:histidine kinase [Flammeovirgaceae bacterium]
IMLLDKIYPFSRNIQFRMLFQLLACGAIAILITSVVISLYFIYLVGFSTFTEELLVFSTLWLVTSIFFNLIYFSIFFLNEQNETELSKEVALRKNLEFQLQTFKNEVNPDLLYSSLEDVISLMHEDVDKADEYINCLSTVYRYTLDNKQDELATLKSEIIATENLLELLNITYNGNIQFSFEAEEEDLNKELIPGTLPTLMEYLVRTTIVSNVQPLKVQGYLDGDNYVVLQSQLNEKLKPVRNPLKEIKAIQKAYSFYTDEPVVRVKAYHEQLLKVPLLSLEVEELIE